MLEAAILLGPCGAKTSLNSSVKAGPLMPMASALCIAMTLRGTTGINKLVAERRFRGVLRGEADGEEPAGQNLMANTHARSYPSFNPSCSLSVLGLTPAI